MPWYGYAAGAAGIFYIGGVVARIAGKAIAEVEAEGEARLDGAKVAEIPLAFLLSSLSPPNFSPLCLLQTLCPSSFL